MTHTFYIYVFSFRTVWLLFRSLNSTDSSTLIYNPRVVQKSWRLFWLSGLNELATTAKEQRSASVRYNLQLVGLEWAKRGATMGLNGGAC